MMDNLGRRKSLAVRHAIRNAAPICCSCRPAVPTWTPWGGLAKLEHWLEKPPPAPGKPCGAP